jgi:RNA polymerase-interacting CarD/CdnL/TRCF family regulator
MIIIAQYNAKRVNSKVSGDHPHSHTSWSKLQFNKQAIIIKELKKNAWAFVVRKLKRESNSKN